MRQVESQGIPLYEQVKSAISRRIVADEWPADYRLPREVELATEFDVSPLTVRRALRELQNEGLVVRVRGRGTFVVGPSTQCAIFALQDVSEEIELGGGVHSSDILFVSRLAPRDPRCRLLAADGALPVIHSRLVHKEDGNPIQLEDRYVNAEIAPDYADQDFTRITPHGFLLQTTHVTSVDNTIRAIRPDAETQALLMIDASQPCLLLDRRTWNGSVPITRSRFVYPGDRYRLKSAHDAAPLRASATPSLSAIQRNS